MDKVEEFKILPAFSKVFHSDKPYFVLTGGRGGGKSTQCAAYFVIKLFDNDQFFRGVVSRYTARSVKFSIYRDICDLIESWGLSHLVEISGEEIRCKLNDNMIITHSMRLADGTMSAKGKGLSHVTALIIDEASELPSEEEYIKVVDTFREKNAPRKIFVIFNPGSKRSWLFKRWFIGSVHNPNPKWYDTTEFIHTTYLDNLENLDPTKVKEWDRARYEDPIYYRHHLEGEFTDGVEGQIYRDFQIGRPHPLEEYETVYGIDFGFASDPTAVVEVKTHNQTLYAREVVYETGLTSSDLITRLRASGITNKDILVADSAEPRSIEELKRAGFKVYPCYKGPDSIQSGIAKIKSFSTFMHPDSTHLHEEVDLYSWNKETDRPLDKWNHALDAIRYALSLTKASGKYAAVGAPSNLMKDFEDKSHKVTSRRKY